MQINKVLCVGAALNDILLQESDDFLKLIGKEKGGMTLVEKAEIDDILAKSSEKAELAPGGSACNTAVGLAKLGGDSSFLGKRGNDEPGNFIESQLGEWGVKSSLVKSDNPTGQVLSIITPDAERSMFTYLGAAAEINCDEISDETFKGFDLVHIEGYLLFNNDFAMKVLKCAKAAGCRVSLDLSSFEVVRIFKDALADILANYVDVIIANEDESKEYTGVEPHESLEIFRKISELAIVKLGADGVLVACGEEKVEVKGTKVNAVDTTGAGDLWASGFIYGLTQGWSLTECAQMGNKTGSSVVQVVGAVIPDEVYAAIKE
ncbi:MAG: adenosine kinase [Planctomycetes bacterium]|nr:adenosine kinase [Planctomycetota bacterium]